MNIRNATYKDIPAIAALSRRFTKEIPTWGQEALTVDYLQKVDLRLIWVVEDKDKLVGFALCQPRKKDDSCIFTENDKVLALDEIYLVPEARRRKVGAQLLKTIEDFAREEGYTKIFVYSAVKSLDPVLKFYRDNGFKTWSVQFFKEVTRTGE